MTTSALVMLVVTWLVVGGLTLRFFLMVLRTPLSAEEAGEGEPHQDPPGRGEPD